MLGPSSSDRALGPGAGHAADSPDDATAVKVDTPGRRAASSSGRPGAAGRGPCTAANTASGTDSGAGSRANFTRTYSFVLDHMFAQTPDSDAAPSTAKRPRLAASGDPGSVGDLHTHQQQHGVGSVPWPVGALAPSESAHLEVRTFPAKGQPRNE